VIFSWRAAHRFGITHGWLRAGRKCGAFNRVRSRNSCCNAAVTGTRRRQFEQHQRLQYECIKSSAVINIGRKARTTGMGASSASLSIRRNQCGRLADPESSLRGHTCRTRSMLIDAASFNQQRSRSGDSTRPAVPPRRTQPRVRPETRTERPKAGQEGSSSLTFIRSHWRVGGALFWR